MEDEIFRVFIADSTTILEAAIAILTEVEENPQEFLKLTVYSNAIDRVMGGAATVAMSFEQDHAVNLVRDYAAACKSLSLQVQEVSGNAELFRTLVALLLDATEVLGRILGNLNLSTSDIKKVIPQNSIERVKVISDAFKKVKKIESQSDLDQVLKKYSQ